MGEITVTDKYDLQVWQKLFAEIAGRRPEVVNIGDCFKFLMVIKDDLIPQGCIDAIESIKERAAQRGKAVEVRDNG